MVPTPEELKNSRYVAVHPARIAALAAVLASVISICGTYLTLRADSNKHNTERLEQLEDTQRSGRKDAYETFLAAAYSASIYERDMWCESGTMPSLSGGEEPNFKVCDADDGSQAAVLAKRLDDAMPPLLLYSGDDTRSIAYGLSSRMSWIIGKRKDRGAEFRASDLSDSPLSASQWFQKSVLDLGAAMCKEQSALPNACQAPSRK
jgi:hypothetical protein